MVLQALGVALAAIVGLGYFGIKQFYPWLLMDLQYIIRILPFLRKYAKLEKDRVFLVDVFEQKVTAAPDKVFIVYEDKAYTYREVNDQANRVARTALLLGLKPGDVVAVMMLNEVAFIWTYLGLLKVGLCLSFINTNLRGKPLLHCLSVSETNTIVVGEGAELIEAVSSVLPELPNATVYVQGSPTAKLPARFKSLLEIANRMSSENTDRSLRETQNYSSDAAMYIFTSGTTGLPKPARISHKKTTVALVVCGLCGLSADDIVYVTMPLFHSSALLVGISSVILTGSTCVLDQRFSKTNFMDVCRKHNVTVMIYVGELCRYLLSNEKSDLDKQHSVRLAIGNGLRQDIFAEFKERFNIQHIVEFYGATEGPLGFMNCNDVVGSCGRCSPFLEIFFTAGFYQWDVDNECMVRDEKGHCIPVKLGTPGLLLVAINKLQVFDGYKGKKELTESKLVRNVRRDGDVFFNSGDLMTRDDQYNLYFNDRVGDTFRWKGENVSTTEVSNMLTDVDFVVDACVYGVSIPGHDGRAGMAALLISPDMTTSMNDHALQEFSRHCNDILPLPARPVFLRVKNDDLDLTATAKQSKIRMKKEGFDKDIIEDAMFYYDRSSGRYKQFTKDLYKETLNKTLLF